MGNLTEKDILAELGLDGDAGIAGTSGNAGIAGTSESADAQWAADRNQAQASPGDDSAATDDYDDNDADDDGGDAGADADAGKAETSETQGIGETSKEGLTPEKRRANAKWRRKQEVKAAVDTAVAEALEAERAKHQTELSTFFEGAQLINTLTNQPIKNLTEFHEWKRAYDTAQMQCDLQAGKLTPEALDRAIAENPVVKKADEAMRQTEAEQRQRSMDALKAQADAEIAEIGKLDPSIKSIEDILAMPTGQAFRSYVQRGNSFIDAFRLANWAGLTAAAAAAASGKQQADINNHSKDHLTATQARGSGAIEISPEEKRIYKFLNPDDSTADMQAFFEKNSQRK